MTVLLKAFRAPPEWLLFAVIAIFAGTLYVWLLIGWREIDPLNLGWLWGDPSQYEAGWEFLRREPVWTFPPTWLSRLDYPLGVSASNLDIIPLVGVALRPIASLLPENFQYLGVYAVTCFILQAYFGFRLASCFSRNDRVITLIGGLFFLIAPILTSRLGAHFPQLSQWIVVASLYCYFRYTAELSLPRFMRPFVILAMFAGAITPYVAAMTVVIGATALVRAYFDRRDGRTAQAAKQALQTDAEKSTAVRARAMLRHHLSSSYGLWGLFLLLGSMLTLTAFGFVVLGPQLQFAGEGYTHYSMNILAPIDPQGEALYFRNLPIRAGQYEGYNYLGMGVILLGLLSIARRPALLKEIWAMPQRPLFAMSILLTLLALSARVTLGQSILFTVPLPRFVFHLLAGLRSSGRLFWPVHYVLVVAAIAGSVAAIPSRVARRVILAAALILQYFDLMPMRDWLATQARTAHPNPLVAADWAAIPLHHGHLVILPALQCDSASPGGYDDWARFALLAARSGMTLNSAYLGRVSPYTHDFDCVKMPEALLRDGPDRDTAYVLRDDYALRVASWPTHTHYCRRVDGFNLCTFDPVRAAQSRFLLQNIRDERPLSPYLHAIGSLPGSSQGRAFPHGNKNDESRPKAGT